MDITSQNIYNIMKFASQKLNEPTIKNDKLKLVGTKNQVEYWKTLYGDQVEYIEVDNFIKG